MLHDGFRQDKAGPSVASVLAVLLPRIGGGQNGTGGSISGIVSEQWRAAQGSFQCGGEGHCHQHGDLFLGTIFQGPQDWAVRPVAEVSHER